jgi:hypothetical protein
MLALLAREGDSDSNISAGHVEILPVVESLDEEKPRPSAR